MHSLARGPHVGRLTAWPRGLSDLPPAPPNAGFTRRAASWPGPSAGTAVPETDGTQPMLFDPNGPLRQGQIGQITVSITGGEPGGEGAGFDGAMPEV